MASVGDEVFDEGELVWSQSGYSGVILNRFDIRKHEPDGCMNGFYTVLWTIPEKDSFRIKEQIRPPQTIRSSRK